MTPKRTTPSARLEAYATHRKRNMVFAVIFGILGVACIAFAAVVTVQKVPDTTFKFDFLTQANPFSMEKNFELEKDKINILVTGMGWEQHEGGDLTDTIMLASINRTSKTVSFLSMPRDLYVAYPKGGAGRINELYRQGSKAFSGTHQKMTYLRHTVEEITGESVDYYANIDFGGFVKFVDMLGGIEIDVPEDLVDTEYPDGNWGYTTFSIKKGFQKIDGKTALKYARSRHSTSDFDRSLRQQLVIKAIKDKLISLEYLTSPSRLKALYYTLNSHMQTDLAIPKLLALALFVKDLPNDRLLSFNLNDSCFQGLSYCQRGWFLYSPPRDQFNGAAILLPDGASAGKVSEYTSIVQFSNLVFNYPEMFIEQYPIHIVNATKKSGIANKLALKLKRFGFNIPERNSIHTTKEAYTESKTWYVYDPADKSGIQPTSKSLEALSLFVFSKQESTPFPKYAKESLTGSVIEVVLSKDSDLFLP